VVGESGAGKTQLLLATLGLLPATARVTGSASLGGEPLIGRPQTQLDRIRGARVGLVFQDPMTSLTPHLRIGEQIAEPIVRHLGTSWGEARRQALALLERVQVPAAAHRMRQYPYELSGGLRQRAMIAIALACDPELLIADEPTTALDVSVQAQIIVLLRKLAREHGAAVMLITHDMGVIAETTDRVAVMYAGRICEIGAVAAVVRRPLHPYSQGLMAAIPTLARRVRRFAQIPGVMPRLAAIPAGCAFNPRCPEVFDRCRVERPPLLPVEGRAAACWLYDRREARAP
jgi:peptide/nickel transport system ATP-binding protein